MPKDPAFEVFQSPANHQFYWRLVGANGEIMASSEAYSSAEHAKRAIVRLGAALNIKPIEIKEVEV